MTDYTVKRDYFKPENKLARTWDSGNTHFDHDDFDNDAGYTTKTNTMCTLHAGSNALMSGSRKKTGKYEHDRYIDCILAKDALTDNFPVEGSTPGKYDASGMLCPLADNTKTEFDLDTNELSCVYPQLTGDQLQKIDSASTNNGSKGVDRELLHDYCASPSNANMKVSTDGSTCKGMLGGASVASPGASSPADGAATPATVDDDDDDSTPSSQATATDNNNTAMIVGGVGSGLVVCSCIYMSA